MADPTSPPEPPVSLERAVSCGLVRSSGGYAVMIGRGNKTPPSDWDPRKNSEGRSRQVLADIEHDEGTNLGLHLHGNLVDVDINAEDPDNALIPALDAMLPLSLIHI